MYFQALEARSETDALKEEIRGLSEQILSVKEEVDNLTKVINNSPSKQKGAAVGETSSPSDETSSPSDAQAPDMTMVASEEMCIEEMRREPYVILVDTNGSGMSWSPSGQPPPCPDLPSSGMGARFAAIGNQLYKSGGDGAMQDCYVATLGQNNWSSIPGLYVSGLK